MAHTPGPWLVGHNGLPQTSNPWAEIVGLSPNNDGTVSVEISPEDARVIAAAPDLLEELRKCAHIMKVTNMPLYRNTVEAAEAAIAKAEGKS